MVERHERCVCPLGHFETGGACVPCKAGSFKSNVSATECTSCVAHFDSLYRSATTREGATSPSECLCDQGAVVAGAQAGLVLDPASGKCVCPPGAGGIELGDRSTARCERCPVGYFKEAHSMEQCTPCTHHFRDGSRTTRTSGANSSALCNACSAAKETRLPQDTFQLYNRTDVTARALPTGGMSMLTAETLHELSCGCPEGHGFQGDQCAPCGKGKYSEQPGFDANHDKCLIESRQCESVLCYVGCGVVGLLTSLALLGLLLAWTIKTHQSYLEQEALSKLELWRAARNSVISAGGRLRWRRLPEGAGAQEPQQPMGTALDADTPFHRYPDNL